MGDFNTQFDELKALLQSCAKTNSKSEKSNLYSTLLQLQEHSTTDHSLLQSLAESSHVLLSVMATDILQDDEEIASQALKCMGFMIYHPSIVVGISGDDVDMVLRSLQKVILSTRIKSVCNLGVWCISVQQLNTSFLDAHIESLVRAIVHALDNPTGSLSTTFEAMQAVMKLETQVNEKMRETSYLWGPPIYRRLVSVDKRERDMSERCLRKIKSLICPPPAALSKVVIVDVKRKLLPAMEELLKQGMKIQAMQAWGWYTRLIGSYAIKNRHVINQLLKIPEQTFPDGDPQVKIASQTAWEALIDALVILPTQESTTEVATQQTYEENDGIFETNRLTKSIKLIMTPLIGVMSSKCDLSVHLSCLNTWNYLLHKLDTCVNHPFVNKTVLEPMFEVVFRAGPDGKNVCSWKFCLDILDSYALARTLDDEKHYSVKWMPWSLRRFDFFVKMVDIFIGHGEVACDAALKIFRSSLKSVRSTVSGSSVPFSEVMSCIDTIINCLKKISESGIGRTFLDFIEIATEELQPSILGSPLYKMKLDTKYTENMNEMNDDNDMVTPVVYFIVLYFHDVINSPSDASKMSKYVTFLLQCYDSNDILHTLTCLLYKFSIPDCLNHWIVVANCLNDYVNSKSEPDDNCDLVVSRFLAYPFNLFSLRSQKNLDCVQIVQPWKSLYMSTKCCENLLPVFDRFLEDYSKIDPAEDTRGYVFLSFCGDAVICVIEHIIRSPNDVGDRKRTHCTKTILQCAARYLVVSYAKAKSNPEILDTTSSVFSTLARVMESFHFDEDIIPFVEIISNPLLQWLSDSEQHPENTIYQLHRLWITTLKSLQISWPPINFNSTFLKLQATLLEATLDHPNPAISNPTVAFWNATYGEQVKLDYPQNLLPVLDKLSRNGKINLGKRRYARIDARTSPPQKHKVTTTLNRCVKRVELMDGNVNGSGSSGPKRKRLELTEHQKEVRRAQQGRSKDCEGRGPWVRTYTSVDFSQENQSESQEESQDVRNVESILEMLKKGDKTV
ncbi:putative telomere-associated protein Rif1 [Helianthus annuus]|nr:putative telomere-associated protein Rif1 [Helianthus annuus]